MKAGKSDIDINTRIQITRISDDDEQIYVGMRGLATHPFHGMMLESPNQYSIGVWLDPQQAQERGLPLNGLGMCPLNLMIDDEFVVICD